MNNTLENRKAFFGSRIESYYGDKNTVDTPFSLIDNKLVHIKNITDTDVSGFVLEDNGKHGWFAARKSFGLLGISKTKALADHEIALIELDIPDEEKYNEFISTYQNNELYPVSDFFDWYRRFTGACYSGRKAFLKQNDINMNDKCTVLFFFDIVNKHNLTNDLMKRIAEYYAGGEIILETTNPNTTV